MSRKKTKTYAYNYEQYEEQGKGPKDIIGDILADKDFTDLTELVIGCWGNPWEENCQEVINGIVANADRFSHIEKLFLGDMDFEECEVSWIMQGDYSLLWASMPQLKELTIKGSMDLELGEIRHEGLESLTIICGGLPKSVMKSIQKADLPNLKKLLLYIGIEDYGFDGDEGAVKELLEKSDFPNLDYLGIVDSEMQDELTKIVLASKYAGQVSVLDLSLGTLTDKGGALLLEKIPTYPNIKKLDIHYHYLSKEMTDKLEGLPIEVDASDANEEDAYDGEIYRYAMLTE
ncbi:STM4015 family protein [Parablautia muri]|uniref:Cytoplasmic protein n=1 Tax=Parablautia muri TaxID=2320879 RepID=A0A9X5GS62_9FIRM|nr:STM4015 family protein [Parablautia muri]NBJ93818.1 cytoplasmic protein [Parablautia muri]